MGQAPTKKVALVVGWNGAGKTACIQRIRGQSSEPLPTTGVIRGSALLKVEPPGGEEIECELDFIDVGSQPKLEAKSASYQPWLDSADCVIFVLDATRTMQRFRPEEVKQAKALIEVISREPEVRDKPFLVLINKSDREDSIPIQEAMELFELERLFKGMGCILPMALTFLFQQVEGVDSGFDGCMLHDCASCAHALRSQAARDCFAVPGLLAGCLAGSGTLRFLLVRDEHVACLRFVSECSALAGRSRLLCGLWVQDVTKSCGFAHPAGAPPMWVKATPDLFPQEVPGLSEELLERVRRPGGSLEEKTEAVNDVFRTSARHLESLQQVLRRRALERRSDKEERFPDEVEEVISEGTYLDAFLEAFDGQSFLLYREEIVPSHEYRLALEVHSGGAYWKGISTQDSDGVRHKVETVGASSPHEGSATIISQFGAAQRGAVFVWRWNHMLDQGPYNLPEWLDRALCAEGNDPLRKLQGELEALRRWEQQVKVDTCRYVKTGTELKDIYVREVLRLWPSEIDHAGGGEHLKKCAWVEGLDSNLFTGRTLLVHRVPYDSSHTLGLHASIACRHVDVIDKEKSPPYRLTTAWHWMRDPAPTLTAPAAASYPAAVSSTAAAASSSSMAPAFESSNSSLARPQSILSMPPSSPGFGKVIEASRPPLGASSGAGFMSGYPVGEPQMVRPGTSSGVVSHMSPGLGSAYTASYTASELVRPGTASGALFPSRPGVGPSSWQPVPAPLALQMSPARPMAPAGAMYPTGAAYQQVISAPLAPLAAGSMQGPPSPARAAFSYQLAPPAGLTAQI
ncbi:unnamed protein product [Polarella glacialis]|uniref:Uncharacterized protein n=1 Tax=Polarella glacialis TaxID=89957 RepID=A0A813JB31_POLGL|nr:unnamed protein product [Polarella glacialis]